MSGRGAGCLAATVALALGWCGGAQARNPSFDPPSHADAREPARGALDVRRAAFGQRDLRMVLDVRTRGSWATRGLRGGRSLCLVLGAGGGRLCVVPGRGGRGFLRHVPQEGRARVIPGAVSRPDGRTVRARFAPRALGLELGRLEWAVESRWRGASDRVPDSGFFSASVSVLAYPHCFAAAARDPQRPCRNPSLRRTVYPRPVSGYLWPNAPCRRLAGGGETFHPCEFGVTDAGRTGTFAMIGDSHAVHWRAALEVVAQANRWRGISITRAGCPFSVQIPSRSDLGPAGCARLHRDTIAYLRAHPEIETIFVSTWAQPRSGPMGGTRGYGGGAAAFGAMLDQLPPSVRRIYVLRDIPGRTHRALACVKTRRKKRLPIGSACASRRARVLIPDPAAAAARARGPRMQVIDLTRFFCGPTLCFPVVGGAYVYKDDNHMNAVFSRSLGPFVLRAMRGD